MLHLPKCHENNIRDKYETQRGKHIFQRRQICLHQLDWRDKPRQQREWRESKEAAAETVYPAVEKQQQLNQKKSCDVNTYFFHLRGQISGDGGVVLLRSK